MTFPSPRPITQYDFQPLRADLLPSNDVLLAGGNPLQSRNTQDSSKSKRNRKYPDKGGDGRAAGFADWKCLASKRPSVEQNTRKAESSLPNGLHPSSQPAPADETSRRDAATGKLNRKASFKVKKQSSWRSYDEGYDLRVSGLVTVAKKKCPDSKVPKSCPASEVVAVRKLSGSSRNASLSMLLRVQGEYFVRCTDAYKFGTELYIVLEHMPISLV